MAYVGASVFELRLGTQGILGFHDHHGRGGDGHARFRRVFIPGIPRCLHDLAARISTCRSGCRYGSKPRYQGLYWELVLAIAGTSGHFRTASHIDLGLVRMEFKDFVGVLVEAVGALK